MGWDWKNPFASAPPSPVDAFKTAVDPLSIGVNNTGGGYLGNLNNFLNYDATTRADAYMKDPLRGASGWIGDTPLGTDAYNKFMRGTGLDPNADAPVLVDKWGGPANNTMNSARALGMNGMGDVEGLNSIFQTAGKIAGLYGAGTAMLGGTSAGTGATGMGSGGTGLTANGTLAADGMGGGTGLTLGGSGTPALNVSMGAGGTGIVPSAGALTLPTAAEGGSTLSTLGNLYKAGTGIYSAYQQNQQAQKNQDVLNDQMTTLQDMYKEGGPWANALKEQLARKDAAAGRNSQYGSRLAQYQALLADQAGKNAGVLGNLAAQSNAANNNSTIALNTLFNTVGTAADKLGFTKYAEDKLTSGAKSAWDYFFG